MLNAYIHRCIIIQPIHRSTKDNFVYSCLSNPQTLLTMLYDYLVWKNKVLKPGNQNIKSYYKM